MSKMTFEELAKSVDSLWLKNEGFKGMLESWLERIEVKSMRIRDTNPRRLIKDRDSLSLYSSVGGKSNKDISFSLRFSGQEVGIVKIENSEALLLISEKHKKQNKLFNVDIPTGKYEWSSGKESIDFRKQFKNNLNVPRIPEHDLESRFIKEMKNPSSSKFGGTFKGIQPVTLSGFPVQFPLPLSASSGAPKESVGHIDILARRRDGGVRISLWELKAPGKYSHALSQLSVYSMTLLKMLDDNQYGDRWFKAFGFNRKKPSKLQIEGVICIEEGQGKKLEKEKKQLFPDGDIDSSINRHIKLFVAYYKYSNQQIRIVDFKNIQ